MSGDAYVTGKIPADNSQTHQDFKHGSPNYNHYNPHPTLQLCPTQGPVLSVHLRDAAEKMSSHCSQPPCKGDPALLRVGAAFPEVCQFEGKGLLLEILCISLNTSPRARGVLRAEEQWGEEHRWQEQA